MAKKIQVEGEKKSESKPAEDKVSKTDLSSALSKVRAEFRAKLDKLARSVNVNLDDD